MSSSRRSAAPSPGLGDSLLLLASKTEVFALQVESMAVRHPELAAECTELSGRMRAAAGEHRTSARAAIALAGRPVDGDDQTS